MLELETDDSVLLKFTVQFIELIIAILKMIEWLSQYYGVISKEVCYKSSKDHKPACCQPGPFWRWRYKTETEECSILFRKKTTK